MKCALVLLLLVGVAMGGVERKRDYHEDLGRARERDEEVDNLEGEVRQEFFEIGYRLREELRADLI